MERCQWEPVRSGGIYSYMYVGMRQESDANQCRWGYKGSIPGKEASELLAKRFLVDHDHDV